ENLKHAETLGGKSTFQATSAHFVLCVYRRRVPLRRLANRGFVPAVLYPSRLSSSCHSEYSATPVSQRLLSQEASCASSSSESLQEDKKLRTFWCASVNSRLISSSTMRAVSSLYSL